MPAGDRFVSVPAETLFAFLESKGFVRSATRSGREVVYERPHRTDSRYKVLVYTSVTVGSMMARSRGADAIRVVALFERSADANGWTYSDGRKMTRIFRTGSVEAILERLLERMREAYTRCNDAIINRVHQSRS